MFLQSSAAGTMIKAAGRLLSAVRLFFTVGTGPDLEASTGVSGKIRAGRVLIGFSTRSRVKRCLKPAPIGFLVLITSVARARPVLDYPVLFNLYPSAATARSTTSGQVPAVVPEPLAGNPAGQPASARGVRAMRLPFRFASADLNRAAWDFPVRVDLRGVKGVRFQLRAEDLSAVSYFTFYFKSGAGWYVAEFSPRDHDRWQQIEILKSETTIEGEPAGWGEISAFRFSAWRSHRADTAVELAGFGLLTSDRRVIVARGSHDFSRLPAGEKSSVLRYARRAADFLGNYGLTATFVEDKDLDADFLAAADVVVLPYNPQLPESAARALSAFTRRGGRLVGFHSLPPGLEAATGLRQTGLVGQREVAGGFARISLSGTVPAGAPAEVEQDSWNITEYQSTGSGAGIRVLATWRNRDGADTGYPALLATARALWLSHVLVNAEAGEGGRLLFAMVAHFLPELWREAAATRLQRCGGGLPYEDFNQAYRDLRRLGRGAADIEQWLARAARTRRDAHRLLAAGRYHEIMTSMEAAEQALTEAYLRVQPARAGEFRGAWCHNGEGVAGWGWDRTVDRLRSSGFNAIIANMVHPAMAWYPSRHLPRAPAGPGNGNDQLAALTAAAERHGLEAHVWVMAFRLGTSRDNRFTAMLHRENRLLVNRDGTVNEDWLCPADPRNRALMLAVIREIAENYPVSGVHLDYIRYPSPDTGYGVQARRLFEQQLGRRIINWPEDLDASARLAAQWRQFRIEQINGFVREVRRVIDEVRPGLKLSAAVFRNESSAVNSIAQDWHYWAGQGWLDFVTPMNYTDSVETFTHALRRQVASGRRFGLPVYPGIGLTTHGLGSIGTVQQIVAARQVGGDGFVLFEINRATATAVFPDLKKGVTRY